MTLWDSAIRNELSTLFTPSVSMSSSVLPSGSIAMVSPASTPRGQGPDVIRLDRYDASIDPGPVNGLYCPDVVYSASVEVPNVAAPPSPPPPSRPRARLSRGSDNSGTTHDTNPPINESTAIDASAVFLHDRIRESRSDRDNLIDEWTTEMVRGMRMARISGMSEQLLDTRYQIQHTSGLISELRHFNNGLMSNLHLDLMKTSKMVPSVLSESHPAQGRKLDNYRSDYRHLNRKDSSFCSSVGVFQKYDASFTKFMSDSVQRITDLKSRLPMETSPEL